MRSTSSSNFVLTAREFDSSFMVLPRRPNATGGGPVSPRGGEWGLLAWVASANRDNQGLCKKTQRPWSHTAAVGVAKPNARGVGSEPLSADKSWLRVTDNVAETSVTDRLATRVEQV